MICPRMCSLLMNKCDPLSLTNLFMPNLTLSGGDFRMWQILSCYNLEASREENTSTSCRKHPFLSLGSDHGIPPFSSVLINTAYVIWTCLI